mmetsp:Transcript_77214/g.153138  ORF Transcript_77214/g.153138 Transcript_77214/m.153138 type:complete len:96 (+) Transcript_77214:342-629(+)
MLHIGGCTSQPRIDAFGLGSAPVPCNGAKANLSHRMCNRGISRPKMMQSCPLHRSLSLTRKLAKGSRSSRNNGDCIRQIRLHCTEAIEPTAWHGH